MQPTEAVLLTALGRGAIATVSVRGPLALDAVSRWFHSHRRQAIGEPELRGRIHLGRWGDAALGEELVVVLHGDNQIEVHAHGGRATVEKIISDLESCGCQRRQWPDIVLENDSFGSAIGRRATLALTRAGTQRTAAILLDQCRGALDRALDRTRVAVERDCRQDVQRELLELSGYGELGLHLTTPWRVVLAGEPNVGKSSLLNVLLGFERAIVIDQPGTTRDVLSGETAIGGWPIALLDVAGIRQTDDGVEQAGVRRAEQQIDNADRVLLVADVSRDWNEQQQQLLERHPHTILVLNKTDLLESKRSAGNWDGPEGQRISCLTGEGIPDLWSRLRSSLVPREPERGQAVPFERRQVDWVRDSLEALQEGRPIGQLLPSLLALRDGREQ